VSAAVSIDTPVTWVGRGDAFCARRISSTIEKSEVGGHKVRTRRHPYRKFGGEVICNTIISIVNVLLFNLLEATMTSRFIHYK